MVNGTHAFISAEIPKSQISQQFFCLFDICAKLFRSVAVTADGQDFSSQVTIKLQDVCGRHGILQPVSVRRSINLNPLSLSNEGAAIIEGAVTQASLCGLAFVSAKHLLLSIISQPLISSPFLCRPIPILPHVYLRR